MVTNNMKMALLTLEELDEGKQIYTYEEDPNNNAPTYSMVHLSYRDDKELDSILLQYSLAVKMVTSPLFVMTTGCFSGTLAGQDITFMVDSGSELNLISEDLHSWMGVTIDLDSVRWFLKGINNGPVSLVGCCREIPVAIGGANAPRNSDHLVMKGKKATIKDYESGSEN
jgi:hypothetical protein